MEVVHERCCGVDVHKKTVVACVITPAGQQTRSFGTTTRELRTLADWLEAEGVTHVAMESTGVFWRPVSNVLDGRGLTLLVVNAQHIKAIPGRKTDVKDAAWIADLLRHGLLRGSRIPDRAQREQQELVRYRTRLLQERAQVVQRIQKVLEGANIKLSAVLADVVGVSGRAMLEALVAGTADAEALAALARGRLRAKHAALTEALEGSVGPAQRVLLDSHLHQLDFLDGEIARLSEEIAERFRPFEAALVRLDTIPGIGQRAAERILAEIGADVSDFPTAGHLASWAGLCPGNHQSAGKRLSGRTRHGNTWLKAALVEAAWGAVHTRDCYLAALYHRLAARRGAKRAIVAVAHALLVIVYHLLRDSTAYRELGGNYFDERDREATARRSVRRLERLGFKVTLEVA
ncbi:MAG TPA: IS110 family transposase [Chloroflexota bacterium]|nr:IS110 family transposase [Chloroflexota bacterium]